MSGGPFFPLGASLSVFIAQDDWRAAQDWNRKIKRCEETAQGILDARALYPDKTLAWLYDDDTMPPELRAAHEANNFAVMDLYGFRHDMTEEQIVAELFKLYQYYTELEAAEADGWSVPEF